MKALAIVLVVLAIIIGLPCCVGAGHCIQDLYLRE
jgi:hypothetical protein